MKKFFKAVQNALNGLEYAIKTQRNLRIHFIMMVIIIAIGFWVHLLRLEWAIIYLTFSAVIGMEIINSSIEKLLDKIHPEKHEAIKHAKDMAAAAVLVVSVAAIIVAFYILYPRLTATLSDYFQH